jgi:hypothetical protein
MKKLGFLLTLFVFFSACKEDVTEPTPDLQVQESQDLTVRIHHKFDGKPLVFNDEVYTLASGEEVNFSRLAYLMADFYLENEAGERFDFENLYAFINANKQDSFTLTGLPQGTYKAFGFTVGLDSTRNHGDPNQWPTDHPLSPINNSLHWSWQSGYIFTAIEGGLSSGWDYFVFHLAGSMNTKEYRVAIDLEKTEEPATLDLDYLLDEVFVNPEVFSLEKDGKSAHSVEHPVTKKLTENMGDQFVASKE